MKRILLIFSVMAALFIGNKTVIAHCQVPCGIYNDELRIELIKEHIQTIEKAMNEIVEIQSSDSINYNQLVRWVNAKEKYANLIQEIANQYFLTQRVKFASPDDKEAYAAYISQLTYLHQIMVFSMKAKQTTDTKYIENLRDALANFEVAYFGKDAHRHDIHGNHK